MYLRHSTIRKNGKVHTYWRLVRSVRRNGRVVQETVAQSDPSLQVNDPRHYELRFGQGGDPVDLDSRHEERPLDAQKNTSAAGGVGGR